jgi:hypothetical protein
MITWTTDAHVFCGMLEEIPNVPGKCVSSNKNVLLCDFIMEKNYTYSLHANHTHTVKAAISTTV